MNKNKFIYRKGLMQHHYRFGLLKNIKVWFCRTFGHKMNDEKKHQWCDRCGLASSEIYHSQKDDEDEQMEKLTEHNSEVISDFIEHVKDRTGHIIQDNVFESFFNA